MQDVGDGTPLVEVGAPERDELGRGVQDLAFANDDLMQGVLVHELIVVTSGLRTGINFAFTWHASLRRLFHLRGN